MANPDLSSLIEAFDRIFSSDLNPFDSHPPFATAMAFSAFVSAFNSLPRPRLDLCNLGLNHWHFSLRNIDISFPNTILVLVSPTGRYVQCVYPPTRDLAYAPLQVQAHVSAILLLKAFASEDLGRSRPWSWSTDCPDMAFSVSMYLKEFGVRDGLETVLFTSPRTMRIVDEEWLKFLTALLQQKLAQEREKLVWL